MIFKNKNSMFDRCKEFAATIFFFIVLIVVCGCSSARDVNSISQLAISPDGNEFFFRYQHENKESSLVRFNSSTGAIQVMLQPVDEIWSNPTYSVDGKWLAIGVYSVNTQRTVQYSVSRIDVMRTDGSERRTVVPQDGLIKSIFRFSPDGKRLLFAEGSEGRLGATRFTIHEIDLETLRISAVVMANFYQLSSLTYLNKQFAYVGIAPLSYRDSQSPVPNKYIPTANSEQKSQWAMQRNSMMYVTDANPEKLVPYVSFEIRESSNEWEQEKEIEELRIASKTNRMFVAMRHNYYPKDQDIRHYIRDIFEMNSNGTFRRLTFFNTVQFNGFDATPDGRYVAAVPDNSDDPVRSAAAIYRIDSINGEVKVFEPDLSKLAMPH
jgi:dipeptidyl aminopeptidase/acylaminoacyl peptidase